MWSDEVISQNVYVPPTVTTRDNQSSTATTAGPLLHRLLAQRRQILRPSLPQLRKTTSTSESTSSFRLTSATTVRQRHFSIVIVYVSYNITSALRRRSPALGDIVDHLIEYNESTITASSSGRHRVPVQPQSAQARQNQVRVLSLQFVVSSTRKQRRPRHRHVDVQIIRDTSIHYVDVLECVVDVVPVRRRT